ncbi:hypothetical protein RvY_03671 [Ramazzottius varieornatus]|uniref:Reverse transcriptase domain-containing protein n=1 Tax=Ramazzottius varieornatus TaxID=947166 RepID=A0A1D1UY95_RAMVA|nr:hypothetical protein RvY_03671 [Ramazzottius varieornatus]
MRQQMGGNCPKTTKTVPNNGYHNDNNVKDGCSKNMANISPKNLIYGEHVIHSARGVQQGDPLGPLLFCLLTRNLSKSLQSPFNVWYLDDATLGGDFELVSRDFQTIVKIGASLGLELNTSKCEFVVC